MSQPGNAPGVPPSGRCSSPGAVPLSRPRALLPFAFEDGAVRRRTDARSSELSSPRRIRTARAENLLAADALLAFLPSKALPASAVEPDRSTTTRPRERGDETFAAPPPLRFSRARRVASSHPDGAPEYSPAEASAFPLSRRVALRLRGGQLAVKEAPAFLGFVTSSRAAAVKRPHGCR